MSAIEVRGLTKRFGPVLAVDQLSFEVERGTVTGFLGSNGAGKASAGIPLPFAAAAALLAGLAVLFCVVAARTTVARDVS